MIFSFSLDNRFDTTYIMNNRRELITVIELSLIWKRREKEI